MDNVTKNQIHNIMYRYGIEENMDNFNKIAEHINGKENCIIIHENTRCLKIEICSEEHRHLLDDISKSFFLKITRRRRVDFASNLFFTILIYK